MSALSFTYLAYMSAPRLIKTRSRNSYPARGSADGLSVNLDFFAAESDQRALLDFLFASTEVRVFESYSEFDADLREFRSTDELASNLHSRHGPAWQWNGGLLAALVAVGYVRTHDRTVPR